MWPSQDILQAVQHAHVYDDCKHFVDLLEEQPEDWEEQPKQLLQLDCSDKIRVFALQVHGLWKILCRKVASSVSAHPDRHTLLPQPHPVFMPGDRFRENYYWDSFWIIKGLLASGMTQSATNVLLNLLSLLDAYGFVPNGGRSYYCNRSQPPLLSAMVELLWTATGDRALLAQALPLLVREHDYWSSGSKQVRVRDEAGAVHSLARYHADWFAPRPESYREDEELARGLDPAAAAQLYCEIASAAESGWDFSSRWFADKENLSTIQTTKVVPVDLNAFLCQMESHISSFAAELGDEQLQGSFREHASKRLAALQAVLWCPGAGCWLDLLLKAQDSQGVWTGELNCQAFASNWVPLWCGCCQPGSDQAEVAVAALQDSQLVMEAGVCTSLNETGQQWDYPNAWPPLQHMLVEGLLCSGTAEGAKLAIELGTAWVTTNLLAWRRTGRMHEKYDATELGGVGGGGEYVPQTGFGWSNGVLLDMMLAYGPFVNPDAGALAYDDWAPTVEPGARGPQAQAVE